MWICYKKRLWQFIILIPFDVFIILLLLFWVKDINIKNLFKDDMVFLQINSFWQLQINLLHSSSHKQWQLWLKLYINNYLSLHVMTHELKVLFYNWIREKFCTLKKIEIYDERNVKACYI